MDKVVMIKLNPFFHDHRARSFVKISAKYKLIQDLLDHVKEIFDLDHNVILKTDNDVYLPEKEDISVINAETILRIEPLPTCDGISCKQTESVVIQTKKKNKSKKRKTQTIEISEKRMEDPLAHSSAKKKKIDDHNKISENITFYENLSSNKQKSLAFSETHKPALLNKPKNDTDINSKLENILQCHVANKSCETSKENETGSSSKSIQYDREMVSITNVKSNDIKVIPAYTPARIILPSKNIPKQINIIKNIVTTYDNSQILNASSSLNMSQICENTNVDISNTQCAPLHVASNAHEHSTEEIVSVLEEQQDDAKCETESHSDMTRNSKGSYHEVNFDYSKKSNNTFDGTVPKISAVVDIVENKTFPNSPMSGNEDALSTTQSESACHVTRRRVRRRKKKTSLDESQTAVPAVQYTYRPMLTRAKPLIHKHFNDNEVSQIEDSSITLLTKDESKISMNGTNDCEHSQNTEIKPSVELSSLLPINGKRNGIVKDTTELHPKPNDTVVFQMLKVNDNYEPVKSNIIRAVVQTFDKDTKEICVIVKEGLDEFKAPVGNLSLAEEDESIPDENQILKWDLLINPRIQN